jgi:hypothetical protein
MTESEAKEAVVTEATEAAPLSPEEMGDLMCKAHYQKPITADEEARAIATSVCLEKATNWILAHERDAGVKVIPALETVRDALCEDGKGPARALGGPSDYYDGNACMDACRLACRGRDGVEAHFVASAIQYLWRSGRKGPALPDLMKARDMVDRLMGDYRKTLEAK